MKYMGLDLGSRTCGIAVSDELGILAHALTTLRFQDEQYTYCAKEVVRLCKEQGVKTVVLGLPKHMNGDIGLRAQISIDFKKKLEELGNLEVILIDERLTTLTVDRIMISGNVKRNDRHKKKDEMAAVVILQDYLNSKGY